MLKTVALHTVIVILRLLKCLFLSKNKLQNEGDILRSSQDLMTVAFMLKKHVIINYFWIFCSFSLQFICCI